MSADVADAADGGTAADVADAADSTTAADVADAADSTDALDLADAPDLTDVSTEPVSCGTMTCGPTQYCVHYMEGHDSGTGAGPQCVERTPDCTYTGSSWCYCFHGCPGTSYCDSLDPATRSVYCHNV